MTEARRKLHYYVKGKYIGSTLLTTESEVRAELPYAEIRGDRVDIWEPPPKARRC